MKIFFVTQAPERHDGLDTWFMMHGGDIQPQGFLTMAEAEDHAIDMARDFPGKKVWILEGEPIKALYVEPAAVQEVTIE